MNRNDDTARFVIILIVAFLGWLVSQNPHLIHR